jgi:putative DNA primase/helicase
VTDPYKRIADIVEGASPQPLRAAPPAADADDASDGDACDTLGPSDQEADGVDMRVVERCAKLDQSDTDNGRRLIEHFGADLVVMAQGEIEDGAWLAWDGRYWDLYNGVARANIMAQMIGGRIGLETRYLQQTPAEARVIEEADNLSADDESDAAKAARRAAAAAEKALEKRRLARWRFAVSSKNSARLAGMLKTAASHLRREPGGFNADSMLIVTQNATLRVIVEEIGGGKKYVRLDVRRGFSREDYATGLVPCDFDLMAKAAKWDAFLLRCLPSADMRRTVRQYAGLGLVGTLLQKLMFHHGFGANGKSVFLAVISGVIGKSYGVSLPKETILGRGERGAGQASPDIVRLFGKRFVRIDELKEDEALREDLVKRLTGGDEMAVRNLFEGYFDFANRATPHMSGNGFPKIDGTDNGIWRRMLVVHWSVTIPPEERREFDGFVAELLEERSGILNWLLDGVLDYLEHGLFIAPEIAAATSKYQEEMNPIGEFIKDCVEAHEGERVAASTAYQAYVSWSMANAKRAKTQTAFGREMAKLFRRDNDRARSYLDCRLHDVPDRPEEPAKARAADYPEGYGG